MIAGLPASLAVEIRIFTTALYYMNSSDTLNFSLLEITSMAY